MTRKLIESAAFPGNFLVIDGSWLTTSVAAGGGKVLCSKEINHLAASEIDTKSDGTTTIGSSIFPNVFLRLDGSAIHAPSAAGGGVVNAQYGAGAFETFRLIPQLDGSVAIASTAFQNVYLRMDAPAGQINGQGSIGPWEKFFIRDFTENTVDSPAGQWPFSPVDQCISVPIGVSIQNNLLTGSEFGGAVLQAARTADDLQSWAVVPVTGVPGEFNIVVSAKPSGGRRFLNCMADGTKVNLADRDDGSGRQRWLFNAVGDTRLDYYNIRVAGGLTVNQSYLSAAADGSLLSIVAADDSSGRQRWEIKPRTDIKPENLDDWQYEDSIELGAYLAANAARTSIRLFACEVVVNSDVVWQTDAATLPADIRIDCGYFRVQGRFRLDVSGSPDHPETLDLDSYCPTADSRPAAGVKGYDGGKLVINALTFHYEQAPSFALLATGGTGGKGQKGYPGRVGPQGIGGVPGGRGEAGGNGGSGGPGGDGGTIIVRFDRIVPTLGEPNVATDASGGIGGTGGAAGPGGNGGPPGTVGGKSGDKGPDGAPGPQGTLGADGTIKFNEGESALDAMQQDNKPESLRTRIHTALSNAIYGLMRFGDKAKFDQQTYWLRGILDRLPYDDVKVRFADIDTFLNDKGASTAWTADLHDQIATMRADTLTRQLTILSALPSSDSAPSSVAHFVHNIHAEARGIALDGPNRGLPSAWTEQFSEWLAEIPQGTGQFCLDTLMGNDACVTREVAAMAAAITPDQLAPPPSAAGRLRPMGLFLLPLLPLLVGAALFGLNVGVSLALRARRAEADRRRKEEEAQKRREEQARQEQIRKFEQEVERWKYEQTQRQDLDSKNADEIKSEDDQDKNRRQRKRRSDDYIPDPEWKFCAILDSLESAEDDSNCDVAVFDGFPLFPLTDPATFIAVSIATAKFFPAEIRLKLNRSAYPELRPGAWHVLSLGPPIDVSGSNVLQMFVQFPRVRDGKKSWASWALIGMPEIPVSCLSVQPLPLLASLGLDFAFQYITTPLTPRTGKSPASSSPALRPMVAIEPSTVASVQNVGMAAFHTFANETGANIFAFDVGNGAPIGLTQAALNRLAGLVQHGAVIVISHWDRDHYASLTNAACAMDVQAGCRIVGPSFGMRGPKVSALVRAIASNGPGHLWLVGHTVENWVKVSDDMNTVALTNDVDAVMAHDDLGFPANIHLTLTSLEPFLHGYDKNNTEAISMIMAGGQDLVLLLPGDASFTYIYPGHQAQLTHLEATHHGSRRSILRAGGRQSGTAQDNDIPRSSALHGTIIFSYGANNWYGISAENVIELYASKNWTLEQTTSSLAENSEIDVIATAITH